MSGKKVKPDVSATHVVQFAQLTKPNLNENGILGRERERMRKRGKDGKKKRKKDLYI